MTALIAPAARCLTFRLIHGLLGIGSYVVFSHLVDPEAYGRYAIIVALVTATAAFGYTWIGVSLVRLRQLAGQEGAGVESAASRCFVVVSLVILVLWGLAAPLAVGRMSAPLYVAAGVLAILLGWFDLIQHVAQARSEIHHFARRSILRSGVLLALGWLLVREGPQTEGLMLAYGAGLLAAAGLTATTDVRRALSTSHSSRAALGRLWRFGMPIAGGLGLAWLVDYSDRILIWYLLGEAPAGRYALVADMARYPVWLVMSGVALAIAPVAARAHDRIGTGSARAVMAQALILLLLVGLPVIVVEVLAAGDLGALLVGEPYRGTVVAVMPLIAIATGASAIRCYYLEIGAQLGGRTVVIAVVWALVAGTNIALDLLLIPAFELVGAATATLIAHLMAIALFIAIASDRQFLAVDRIAVAKVVIATAVMGVVLATANAVSPAIVALAGAALVYALAVAALDPVGLRKGSARSPTASRREPPG